MEVLNLPAFEPRIRKGKGRFEEIWDPFRKKFVELTPEEWVRQHILHFLTQHRGYPLSLIRVEAALTYNRLKKRSDVVAYSSQGIPLLLVECKAPQVELTQNVFDQVAMYNVTFSGRYLLVTNGMKHLACEIDHLNKKWKFLPDIPHYSDICTLNHELP
ncbi:MAG: type I restriction enzyme HsdR N-terminal domain-containing protein [Bacteroidia bacterium]|nr:type I restriction enzyme HsdR N-terminal domain-containing protein [Bacteroidia bacterium]